MRGSRRADVRKMFLLILTNLLLSLILSCTVMVYDSINDADTVLVPALYGSKHGLLSRSIRTQQLPIVTFTSTQVTNSAPVSTSWPVPFIPPDPPCVTCWPSVAPAPVPEQNSPWMIPRQRPTYVQQQSPPPVYLAPAGAYEPITYLISELTGN